MILHGKAIHVLLVLFRAKRRIKILEPQYLALYYFPLLK